MKTSRVLPFLLLFYAVALLLNAPALLRSVENLDFEHPARPFFLAAVRPVARLSDTLGLSLLRGKAEVFEKRILE